MRLAFVVQRYGREITGGAEYHCKLVAEHLAADHDVTVVTTCARDYVTWADAYRRGIHDVDGVPVWRFPVRRPRDPEEFGQIQERAFRRPDDRETALGWLDAEGPYSPALIDWVRRYRERYDFWICFSYRYWTTFHALRCVGRRGILVPTAEPDPAIELSPFVDTFQDCRGIVYNSPEERAMIAERADVDDVPGDVVGVGIEEPPEADPERFRDATGIDGPFLLYVGRIDRNKGCDDLFRRYLRWHEGRSRDGAPTADLVLAGNSVLPIPDHPAVRYLGRIDEQTKFDALTAASLLVMPSYYESLSMVLLEAWAMSRPVLVNGACDVLKGQVVRSRGGLYYGDGEEFQEALDLLLADGRLRRTLGTNGRSYYEENYTWPVIEEKYGRLLRRLRTDEASPGGR